MLFKVCKKIIHETNRLCSWSRDVDYASSLFAAQVVDKTVVQLLLLGKQL